MRKHSIKNINTYIVWCLLDYYFLVLYMDRPGVLFKGRNHRLNMELDLQNLFGLHVTCSLWLRPRNPLFPRICAYIRGALLVSNDRRHLFVTPWPTLSVYEFQFFGLVFS